MKNPDLAFFKGMIPIFLLLAAVLAIAWIIRLYLASQERKWLAALDIDDIDSLSGRDFEKFLQQFFERQGMKVTRTRYVGDFGADLLLENGDERTVVQAKRFRGRVGVKAVQEVVASKGVYGCHKAMVVTNSTYTNQAIELARANRVELWGRKKLLDALMTLPPASEATSLEAIVPITLCANCRKPLSLKVLEYCRKNYARFNGSVYCYDCQRKV